MQPKINLMLIDEKQLIATSLFANNKLNIKILLFQMLDSKTLELLQELRTKNHSNLP